MTKTGPLTEREYMEVYEEHRAKVSRDLQFVAPEELPWNFKRAIVNMTWADAHSSDDHHKACCLALYHAVEAELIRRLTGGEP